MPKFSYRARDKHGNEINGEMEAESKIALAHKIRDDGSIVFQAEEITEGAGLGLFQHLQTFFSSVSLKEKIIFANNLSAMVDAGLTLSRSLTILNRESKNKKFKKVVTTLADEISKGESFSNALLKFPEVFPPFFTAMVHAGEESGQLPESLKTVCDQLSKTYELRRKIRGAMIYPAVIIFVIIVIAILMMIFLVPTLSETFESLGAELPLSTRVVIGISDFLSENIIFVIISAFIIGAGLWKFLKTERGRWMTGYINLHLPVIGTITREANSAITMRTLASLISSGVGVVEALSITVKVLQNPYYVEALTRAEKEVQRGVTLASIFQKEEAIYPILVGEMIDVGEETGKLSGMLLKAAEFYEGEVDAVTKNLSTIIEPVLMIMIGIAVGFFAVSMIQPMYSLGEFI